MKVKNFRNIMPIFSNINDTIFYNQKKHFFNLLENPLKLFNDMHCISKIEEEWKQFNPHVKKTIIKEYKESNDFYTFSNLLLDKKINHLPCAIELLDFLLSKEFKFSKKDIEIFQFYHWLPSQETNRKSHKIKELFLSLFSWVTKLKSLLSYRRTPQLETPLLLGELFPLHMHEILNKHASNLPTTFQEKLVYEMALLQKSQLQQEEQQEKRF